jgi:hypothetical protein
MEERERQLVQAKEDMERWAANVRAHNNGIRRDIDVEHRVLSRERHEILSLWAQPPISPKEVAQLRASIATREAQAHAREENAWTHLTVVRKCLAISTAHVSTLEGDLQAAKSLLETSGTRVTRLEAALESTKKLLETTHAEGKLASEAQLNLAA